MNKFAALKIILSVLIIGINIYCILEGVLLGSFLGVACAIGSITALILCLRLINKLRELQE